MEIKNWKLEIGYSFWKLDIQFGNWIFIFLIKPDIQLKNKKLEIKNWKLDIHFGNWIFYLEIVLKYDSAKGFLLFNNR